LSISDAVIPAERCGWSATQPRSGRGSSNALRREAPHRFRAGDGLQKLAARASRRKRRRRWRFADAVHDAAGIAGRVVIAWGVMKRGG